MEKSWDVIFWIDQQAVNYVPSSWANADRNLYKWPVGPSRPGHPSPAELIKNCLDIKKYYSLFPAIFKKTVHTLEEAENCTKKGEFNSDIESTDVEEMNSGPAVSCTNNVNLNIEEFSSTDEEGPSGWNRPRIAVSENLGTILLNATTVLNNDVSSNNSETEEGSHDRTLTNAFIQEDLSEQTSADFSVNETYRNSSDEIAQPKLTVSEKYLVKIISGLVYEVKELKRSINELQTTNLINNRLPYSTTATVEQKLIKNLPATTKQNFQELENIVSSSEDSFNLLVDVLYLVGGDNYRSAIYSCMRKLFTTEVAVQYSSQGKMRSGQKKDSFCDLRISMALKNAIRRRFPHMTDVEFKARVGTFLTTAKDRDGGRQKRQQN